jgi:hypothetical protein
MSQQMINRPQPLQQKQPQMIGQPQVMNKFPSQQTMMSPIQHGMNPDEQQWIN